MTDADAAELDFKVGAKGKKQLVDNKLDTMFRGGKVDNYFKDQTSPQRSVLASPPS